MAFTVTATEGANAVDGILLRVRVLTGAAAASLQTGATKTADTTGTPFSDQSITTTTAGSVVYGAMANGVVNTSFTADARTTIIDNIADAAQQCQYASFRATSATGTPGATILGATAPTNDHGTYAAAEILAAGTIAEDGSGPAAASSTGLTAITSASFTPPAGSLLVAIVAHCSSAVGAITITNSGTALTWHQRAYLSTSAGTGSGVWVADVPGAGPTSTPSVPARVMPGWIPGAPGMPGGEAFASWPPLPEVAPTPPPVPPQAGVPPPPPLPLPPALPGPGLPGMPGGTAFSQWPPAPQEAGAVPPSPVNYITGLAGSGAGYFADQHGTPRMVLGDAVWGLPGNAGRWNSGNWQADYDGYFTTRGAQGFTVAYTKPMGTTQNGGINDDGRTFDGLVPFQGGSLANPSTGLTAAYWARIDYMLASAASQGITVFLNAIGYDSDFESSGPLAGKSSTEFGAYGTALGARYAATPNLIWVVADDYFGGADTQITAFLTGLRGAGASQPITIENYPETTSRQDLPAATATAWGAAHAQYNWCYSYNVTYFGVEKAYLESSPIPVIQGDGYFYQGNSSYEGGSGAFAFDRAIRQDAWHAISSGARGIVHGDEACWQWQSVALADSAVAWYYLNNAGRIRALMESLPNWQLLVPDTSSALVTSGRGTHATTFTSGGGGGQYEVAFTDSYVTASRVSDGSLAVIYLSHATTIGIDQAQMAAGYTAHWADPVTGALTPATAGASYNSGTPGSNSQGDPDWVLVLQAPQSSSGTATAAAAKPSASGSGTVSAPAATGTGTAAGHRPGASAAGWASVTGTGTAAGHRPSASASGAAEDYVGTGTAAAHKAAASGSGWATDRGTGTAAAAKPSASAAGYMVPSGTGTAAAHKAGASLSGQTAQFVGSGTAAAGKPSASASGRATVTGTGTAAAHKAAASASGTFTPLPVTGTGTAAAAKPGASSAGRVEAEGTGAASAHKPAAAASGTFTALGISGSGTAAAHRPSAAASGSVADSTGTGTAAAHKPGAGGSGTFTPLAASGTGTAAGRKPAASASGTFHPLAVTGTGTAGARKPSASAAAHFGIEVTGTGTAAASKPSALARAYWRPVNGTLSYQGSPPFTVARGTIGGVVTLNGTTAVAVAAPAVSASSLILLTVQPGHIPAGWPRVASITPGTGFTLKSGSGSDTAVVCAWYLVGAV